VVRVEIFRLRLEKLKEYLGILNALKKYSKPKFEENPFLRGSGERYLHLSIECMLDMSAHLIADQQWRAPMDYKDVFEVLCEEKVFPRPFTERLRKWAGLRNVLAHDYIKVNPSMIYDTIAKDLIDIEKFMKRMARYL